MIILTMKVYQRILIENDLVNLMSTDLFRKWILQLQRFMELVRSNYNFKKLFKPNLKLKSVGSFQKEYMLYTNKKGKVSQVETYSGNNWYGGFSDHLPVYFHFDFISN